MFSSLRTSISSIWSFDVPVCIWMSRWVSISGHSVTQSGPRDQLTIVKIWTGSLKSWAAGWRIILSNDSFPTFSLILAREMYMYGLTVTKKRKKKEKNLLKDSLIEPWVSCEFGVRPSTFSIWTLLRVATYATEADYPDFKGCCMIASSSSFFIFRSQPFYPCHPTINTAMQNSWSAWKFIVSLSRGIQSTRGILPVMAYTGRLRPKWVSFSDFRYMKGLGFH